MRINERGEARGASPPFLQLCPPFAVMSAFCNYVRFGRLWAGVAVATPAMAEGPRPLRRGSFGSAGAGIGHFGEVEDDVVGAGGNVDVGGVVDELVGGASKVGVPSAVYTELEVGVAVGGHRGCPCEHVGGGRHDDVGVPVAVKSDDADRLHFEH